MISEQFRVSRSAALQWLQDCGGAGQNCMQVMMMMMMMMMINNDGD